ncbi:GNAT family N-acetyltransferase [Aeromicrobium ginsengisoli]|uniref:GNAT family N-acetyltransferase n=1 Tax=Aeromicrobium ginsengisoli TaxID=363867 RepID=A0A5M4FDF8_9ACTN|nr:GNAT family N-acetyltransferase [Aeromicrobium ginsengisoli]KAA1397357.1 GNAT family N-acetyltransferase [Aeromicrobium ginsengisoli]
MSLHLARLTMPVFEALAAEKVDEAERLTGLTMSPWFAERVEIWRYMISLLEGRPDNADWLMQAVVRDDAAIGNAGFKGAPLDGQVELGYSIAPELRRRGYASEVVRLLLDRAAADARVDRVIARIRPDNAASLGVITKAGFVPDGDYLSPNSGLQLQFAHPIDRPPR